ncbi:uncharacterized protein LOC115622272, partial [Scaptodrosophila lebanonensis]|uniref:Uncharacterized protein LOC115622272 n=1 Tax=Drosophila lebanonensis TaxID=7225 RepID=A0A6J2T7R4_DROLE
VVTLLAVVALTAVAFVGAADPECVYRKLRSLKPYWPNPANCSSYYRCSTKNVVRALNCPKGKEFNPRNGKCALAGRGLCKLSLAAPLAEDTNPCADEVNGAFVPNSNGCVDFYICNGQLAYPQKCQSGSYFNTTSASCVPDTTSQCWQNLCIGKSDGTIIPDSKLCATYYECQSGETEQVQCASGSYFDSSLEACIIDEDNKQCWENFCIDKADGSTVADTEDCNVFYICTDQKALAQSCPDGSYFDSDTSNCEPGVCPTDNGSTTPGDSSSTPAEPCDNESTPVTEPCDGETTPSPAPCDEETTPATESCDEITTPATEPCDEATTPATEPCDEETTPATEPCDEETTSSPEPCNEETTTPAPEPCDEETTTLAPPSDCWNGVKDGDLVADPNNCRLYSICQNGILEPRDCEIGNYFDQTIGICVVDSDNICPDNGANDEDACSDNDQTKCGADCWHYKKCENNKWVDEACGSGQYFDETLGVCVIDDDQKCPENSARSHSERSKRSAADDCGCEGGIADNSIVPHPTDCDKYLVCQNKQLIPGNCGPGNLFDRGAGVCVPDSLSTCWICNTKPNGYMLPNPNQCNGYYSCSNGLSTAKTCAQGEYFNGQACVIDVNGLCINPCSCGNGKVAHPICTKYFQCTDGVPKVKKCAAGEGFNATLGQCQLKTTCKATLCHLVADDTTFPVVDDETRFYLCQNKQPLVKSCPTGYLYDATENFCQLQPSCACNQTLCKLEIDVFPTLNGDNTQFCLCSEGSAYLNPCATGYIFSAEDGVCIFTGPCDPKSCLGKQDYSVTFNYEDPDSFCLCVAEQPIPVLCPLGYTFDVNLGICVIAPQPDPRCCRNYCVNKPDYTTYSPLVSTEGFCLCLNDVPTYYDCPEDKKYDPTAGVCLDKDPESLCGICDSTACNTLLDYEPYEALNTTSAFCYCKDGTPNYVNCPEDTIFNATVGVCLEPFDPCAGPICDDAKCCSVLENQAFATTRGNDGFCMCSGKVASYYPCLEGTEFDADYEICLAPVELIAIYCDQTQCDTRASNQPFASRKVNDPTAFCACVEGIANINNCPEGLVFDSDLSICAKPQAPATVCDPTVCNQDLEDQTFEASNGTAGFCVCTQGQVLYESCPRGKEYNVKERACLQPGTIFKVSACEGQKCFYHDSFEPFPAKNTTRGFCMCVGKTGIAIYRSCDSDETFDEGLGMCISETNVCEPIRCINRLKFEPFPARNTSTGFCTCEGAKDVALYRDCSPGQVFNRKLAMCTEPELNEEESIEDSQLEEHSLEKRSVESEENICRAEEKRSVPANCSQYELCLENTWRRRSCPDQRYYNPEQQRCLEPRDDTVCSYAKVSGLPTCNNRTEGQTLSSKSGNCQQYFRCSQHKWHLRSCPKLHHYSRRMRTCILSNGTDYCELERRHPHELAANRTHSCQHTAVRPAPSSCAQFLMCLDNEWWYQQCPLGMYFSLKQNYCVPNDAKQCAEAEAVPMALKDEILGTKCKREQATRASPNSCNSYLLCNNGTWQSRSCDALHYYNATLETCTRDLNKTCVVGSNSTICISGQRRAVPTNCNGYEECKEKQWMRRNCPSQQHFDELLMQCVNSRWTNCQGNGLRRACNVGEMRPFPLAANCTQFYYCEEDVWQVGSCLKGHTYASDVSACVPHAADNKCQPVWQLSQIGSNECVDREDGEAVPHADDCTRFYLCVNQLPSHLQSCSTGSFFDPNLGYCRPNDGTCEPSLTQDVCAGAKNGTLMGYAMDCRAYYNCSGSINATQLLYCPNGQYFNTTASQCRVDRGQCQQENATQSKCFGQQHGTRIEHELYCNLYYACVRGLAIPVACPDQQMFNAMLGQCVEDEKQRCENGQLVDSENNGTDYSCGSLKDGTYVPDRKDCTRYYICSEGMALQQKCAAGSYFDAEQLLCVPDDGSCPYVSNDQPADDNFPPDPMVCEGKHGLILADGSNCNNFYICISGKLRHERCYSGYFFNATLYQCQPFNATSEGTEAPPIEEDGPTKAQPQQQCTDDPIDFADLCDEIGEGASIAEQGDCRRYISCEDEEPTSQRCRNGESYDSILGICRQNDGTCLMENGERVGVCNGKHGQLARDVDNCRGYFVCVNGQKIENECAKDEFFNKTTNMCEIDVLQECKNVVSKKTEALRQLE